MADIFISYANPDRPRAQSLAAALTEEGWNVWWDREIDAGANFEEVIERELAAAKCVIVIWSAASVRSSWVKGEARLGLERGVLIPVLVEDVKQPIDFRGTQAADLLSWNGARDAAPFVSLRRSIARLVGEPQLGGVPQPPHPPPKPRFPIQRSLLLVAAVVLLGVAAWITSKVTNSPDFLSGQWIESEVGGGDVYDLRQIDGDSLEGTFRYADGGQGILSGEVKGRRVTFTQTGIFRNDPSQKFTAKVSLTADKSRTALIGQILYNNDGNPVKLTLRRRQPKTPARAP